MAIDNIKRTLQLNFRSKELSKASGKWRSPWPRKIRNLGRSLPRVQNHSRGSAALT